MQIMQKLILKTSIFLLSAIINVNSQFCLALPAPLSKESLLENSDFSGTIKVLGVIQVADDKEAYKGISVSSYQAWIQIITQEKGKEKILSTAIYCWHDTPSPKLMGAWSVPLNPDEMATIYAKWNEENRCYEAVSWNAKTNKA